MELIGDAEQLIHVHPAEPEAVVGVLVTGRIDAARRRAAGTNRQRGGEHDQRRHREPENSPHPPPPSVVSRPLLEGTRPPYPARPTMTTRSTQDRLVDDYLGLLSQELAPAPASTRRDLTEEITAHIAEARSALAHGGGRPAWNPAIVAGDRRRPAASSGQLGHDPSSGSTATPASRPGPTAPATPANRFGVGAPVRGAVRRAAQTHGKRRRGRRDVALLLPGGSGGACPRQRHCRFGRGRLVASRSPLLRQSPQRSPKEEDDGSRGHGARALCRA